MAKYESEGTWFSAEEKAKRERLSWAAFDGACVAAWRTPQLATPLRLPGGLLADIEYVGPDTVRILRTYTAPEKPRASTFGPLCKEGDCRKLACVAGGGVYCFEHTPPGFTKHAPAEKPADPLDKVLTLRDLKEIHQEADAIHAREHRRAPGHPLSLSYTTRAINARVYDAQQPKPVDVVSELEKIQNRFDRKAVIVSDSGREAMAELQRYHTEVSELLARAKGR